MATGTISYFYGSTGEYLGQLIDDGDSVGVEGYGEAFIYIYGELAVIQFAATIETIGSGTTFNWGINRSFLTSTTGKEISPREGGFINAYDGSTGALKTSLYGYGMFGGVNGNRWNIARMYTTGGSGGGWSNAMFSAGDIINGVLVGYVDR